MIDAVHRFENPPRGANVNSRTISLRVPKCRRQVGSIAPSRFRIKMRLPTVACSQCGLLPDRYYLQVEGEARMIIFPGWNGHRRSLVRISSTSTSRRTVPCSVVPRSVSFVSFCILALYHNHLWFYVSFQCSLSSARIMRLLSPN